MLHAIALVVQTECLANLPCPKGPKYIDTVECMVSINRSYSYGLGKCLPKKVPRTLRDILAP